MTLAGKHIVLGISGGIAAYKTPFLVRQLIQKGAAVETVLTESAAEFVTPTTLTALTGRPPRSTLFDLQAEAAMGHIELARWADALVIAPATAHTIGRLAAGLADDLLTTLSLATPAPVVLAPAMNQQMWAHEAVQENIRTLKARGVEIVGPETGDQACGDVGPGRMSEPETIIDFLEARHTHGPLSGKKVIITAGPTREAIDPVRYISNHSSGKQGYAVAAAAQSAGADVVLISGPTRLATPAGVRRVDVESAEDMMKATHAELAGTDVFIGVAAVADYRPTQARDQKIKRESSGDINVAMTMNPDIIRSVAESKERPPVVVGFAAETNDAIQHARDKRLRKRLDLIVVNDVSRKDIGFNTDENAATLISDAKEVTLDKQSKASLARSIIEAITELLH